jgi:hypothetical protein
MGDELILDVALRQGHPARQAAAMEPSQNPLGEHRQVSGHIHRVEVDQAHQVHRIRGLESIEHPASDQVLQCLTVYEAGDLDHLDPIGASPDPERAKVFDMRSTPPIPASHRFSENRDALRVSRGKARRRDAVGLRPGGATASRRARGVRCGEKSICAGCKTASAASTAARCDRAPARQIRISRRARLKRNHAVEQAGADRPSGPATPRRRRRRPSRSGCSGHRP